MPRKRFISPAFFMNDALVRAEYASGLPLRLAYAGLWCQADRRGYFEWKPLQLKVAIFPFEDVDMVAVLSALCQHGFCTVYEHPDNAGRLYCAIPSFKKWQTFHINEKPDPHIPEPLTPQHLRGVVPAPYLHGASTSVAVTTTTQGKRAAPDGAERASLNLDSGRSGERGALARRGARAAMPELLGDLIPTEIEALREEYGDRD